MNINYLLSGRKVSEQSYGKKYALATSEPAPEQGRFPVERAGFAGA